MADFFDPAIEKQQIVLLDRFAIRSAEKFIRGCEACRLEESQIPLDYLLDQLTGGNPAITSYILHEPAKCPVCRGDVTEKTLVEIDV